MSTLVFNDPLVSGDTKGMTLLEVVVAMGLVFVALLAMAGLATTAIKGAAAGKHMTVATMLAQEKLEEIKQEVNAGHVVADEENVEAYNTLVHNPAYQRTTRILSHMPIPGLQTVSVTVSWAKDQHAVTLSTMLAQ